MAITRTDVAVVGSGVAGLAAAIESAARGARVVVFERAATIGGASAMSGAACCLVDTPLQRANGIDDSVELALRDWARTGGPSADLAWAEAYLRASRTQVHDWCQSLGITWTAIGLTEGNSVPRWHTPEGWGAAIIAALTRRCRELGVHIALESAVTDLDIAGTAPRGLTFQDATGEHQVVARAIVVCTGGFVANHPMVLDHAAHLRELPVLLSGGSPGAVGAGHRLLERANAQFVNLDHIWVYPNGTPDPQDPRGIRGLGVRGLAGDIWINIEGKRFHNETLRGGRSGTSALLAQPQQTAWSVFTAAESDDVVLIDNEYYGTPGGPEPAAMAEFWKRSPYVRRAATPGQLATATGLPQARVEVAIAAIDADLRAGRAVDSAFGRDLTGVRPFSGSSLIALQFFPMAQKNFGGVRTDLDCRVLATTGDPIPGLYAAGEVAGMAGGAINGRAALEGTMFGPCLYSGRVAGAAAGAEVHAAA